MEDVDIVRQVLAGDTGAFEQLIEKHKARVWGIVGRRVPANDVDEVALEVFVAAFRSLASYALRKPFEHWISRIATLRCCDYWRQQERRRETSETRLTAEERDLLLDGTTAAARSEARDREQRAHRRELLDKALARLNAEDRMIITLVHFEEVSVGEAARQTGWSIPKVKIRAMRARRALKSIVNVMLREGLS